MQRLQSSIRHTCPTDDFKKILLNMDPCSWLNSTHISVTYSYFANVWDGLNTWYSRQKYSEECGKIQPNNRHLVWSVSNADFTPWTRSSYFRWHFVCCRWIRWNCSCKSGKFVFFRYLAIAIFQTLEASRHSSSQKRPLFDNSRKQPNLNVKT